MERLKVFEGIPPPYDKKQRMVVPQALRILRLKPGRKYCTVGRLSHEVGWKYQDVVARYVEATSLCARCQILMSPDLRSEERSRVMHTTRGRRWRGGNLQKHTRTANQMLSRSSRSWDTEMKLLTGDDCKVLVGSTSTVMLSSRRTWSSDRPHTRPAGCVLGFQYGNRLANSHAGAGVSSSVE